MLLQKDTKLSVGGSKGETHEGGNKTALINSWSSPIQRMIIVLVDIIHDESPRKREKNGKYLEELTILLLLL